MWQRFTERARKVVFYAQEEAQRFGEGYVSTEHLLLAVVRESDSTAARVLEGMGVRLTRVRNEVEKQLPRGEPYRNQDMTLTPRAKRVIDLAYDEARSMNNNYIGTEHLLLGLVREGDGLAGRVLAKLGVELDRARAETMVVQQQEHPTTSVPPYAKPGAPVGTDSLRDVRANVHSDGAKRGMRFVGTHDYLWEFLGRETCVAFRVLAKSGADLSALKAEITKMRNLDPIDGASADDDPISASAQPEADRIAKAMGSKSISTGHLLLAMVVLSWSSVYLMMSNQGVAYEHLWLLVAQEGDED